MNSLFNDIQYHLYKDEKPSIYLNSIRESELFRKYPLSLLYRLKDTRQSPKYHPEGNVWNHTMLVADEAAKVRLQSRDHKVFMWASLLHDIGKATTTRIRKGRVTAYDHDKDSAELSYGFLSFFVDDHDFINKVCSLVKYHMYLLYVLKGLPFADIKALKKDTDIYEVALLGLCDRLGRYGADPEEEKKNMREFIRIIENT